MVWMWRVVGLLVGAVDLYVRSELVCGEWYGVGRSVFGRLTIRFDGGPSYPAMVDDLERGLERYGGLVKKGVWLTGEEWVQCVIASDPDADMKILHAIRTLMPASVKANEGV